jgi:histidine triad (HIT) family protein
MNAHCIFCKIVAGEISSTRVYEDAEVLAFMDIGPIIKGHTLVIPKQHVDPITQAPIGVLSHVMAVVQRVAQAQVNGLKADGVNVLQANGVAAGQQVPHLHFHVVPRFKTDGHHWNWAAKEYENMEEMKMFA